MRKRIFDSALCLWLLLTSCAIPGMDNGSTGRQDITVTGTDSILIGLKLKDEMLNLGYRVRRESGDSIVFERELQDRTVANWNAAQAGTYSIYGMDNAPSGGQRTAIGDDARPSFRVTYRLVEQDGTVRVVADSTIIENPGSRFERVTNATQHPDSTLIQKVLRQTKQHFENQKRPYPQKTDGKASLRQLK